MDKEMQAKIDEILKAHGRRELNADELDKVVGGSITYNGDYTVSWNGIIYGEVEFNNVWHAMFENFGFNITNEYFQKETGYLSTATKGSTWDDFNVKILNRYWGIITGDGSKWGY